MPVLMLHSRWRFGENVCKVAVIGEKSYVQLFSTQVLCLNQHRQGLPPSPAAAGCNDAKEGWRDFHHIIVYT